VSATPRSVPRAPRPHRALDACAGFVLAALVLAPALLGRTAFLPADLWTRAIPWAFAPPPGAARFPSNPLLSDPAILYAPQLWVVRESLLAGSFPLWNPYFRCGEPLLATAVSGPLAPTQWPVLFFPWPDGFAWSALLRFGLLWMGAYLLGRALELGRSLSLGLAASLCFMPAFIAHFQQPHATVAVWLPWLLLCVERLARAAPLGARAAVRAALPLAAVELAILAASHAQDAFNFGVAGVLYLLLRLPYRPLGTALLARAAGLGALAAGVALGAPLWVPILELLRESATLVERGAMGREWLPSPHVFRLLWDPYALGFPQFGNAWQGSLNFEEEQQYLGILPWVFLVGGALGLARRARREVALLAALLGSLVVCGSLAYGWPPLHGWLSSLPPFSFNRNARFRIFAEASVLLLAALSARGWRGALAGALPWRAASPLLTVAAAAGAVLLFWLGVAGHFGPRPLVALASAGALWLGGSLAATREERRAAGVLVPLLLLADVAPVYRTYHPQVPYEWADPARAVAQLPAALRREERPRIAVQDYTPPDLAALFGAVDVVAYSLPVSARYQLFNRRVLGLADPDRLTRVDLEKLEVVTALQTTCAEWLWTNVPWGDDAADWLELAEERRGLRLYRAKRAPPFAAWHARSAVAGARDAEDAAARLAEARGAFPEPIVVEDGEARPAASAPAEGVAAGARHATPQRIEIELPAPTADDGWVVVRTSFDRGWSAVGDSGAPLRVVPSQVRFLAVEAPAGARRIVLRYLPPRFAEAWGAAAAGGLAVLVAALGSSLERARG
jgi:hypothetical protein